MVQPVQWRRSPKPDERVVKLTHAADEAAQRGEVRLAGVVLITPTLEVECEVAGDLDPVKRDLLIGGLVRLIRKISE